MGGELLRKVKPKYDHQRKEQTINKFKKAPLCEMKPTIETTSIQLHVPLHLSDPQWVLQIISGSKQNHDWSNYVEVSDVELSVPNFIEDMVEAIECERNDWVHLDLTFRYFRVLDR